MSRASGASTEKNLSIQGGKNSYLAKRDIFENISKQSTALVNEGAYLFQNIVDHYLKPLFVGFLNKEYNTEWHLGVVRISLAKQNEEEAKKIYLYCKYKQESLSQTIDLSINEADFNEIDKIAPSEKNFDESSFLSDDLEFAITKTGDHLRVTKDPVLKINAFSAFSGFYDPNALPSDFEAEVEVMKRAQAVQLILEEAKEEERLSLEKEEESASSLALDHFKQDTIRKLEEIEGVDSSSLEIVRRYKSFQGLDTNRESAKILAGRAVGAMPPVLNRSSFSGAIKQENVEIATFDDFKAGEERVKEFRIRISHTHENYLLLGFPSQEFVRGFKKYFLQEIFSGKSAISRGDYIKIHFDEDDYVTPPLTFSENAEGKLVISFVDKYLKYNFLKTIGIEASKEDESLSATIEDLNFGKNNVIIRFLNIPQNYYAMEDCYRDAITFEEMKKNALRNQQKTNMAMLESSQEGTDPLEYQGARRVSMGGAGAANQGFTSFRGDRFGGGGAAAAAMPVNSGCDPLNETRRTYAEYPTSRRNPASTELSYMTAAPDGDNPATLNLLIKFQNDQEREKFVEKIKACDSLIYHLEGKKVILHSKSDENADSAIFKITQENGSSLVTFYKNENANHIAGILRDDLGVKFNDSDSLEIIDNRLTFVARSKEEEPSPSPKRGGGSPRPDNDESKGWSQPDNDGSKRSSYLNLL